MKLMILVLALFSSSVLAKGEDLANCLEQDGSRMDTNICSMLREEKAADDARIQAEKEKKDAVQKKQAEDARLAREAYLAEEARKEEERQRYLKQMVREIAEENAEEAKVEAVLKRKCGKDYKNPRIGMPLLRAHLCVGPLSLESKTHTKDGVVFAYDSEYAYIKMIDGKIISWQKY